MSDALDPTRKEILSSHLDREGTIQPDAESLIHENFSAQLHYRNLETVSRATRQATPAMPPMPDFLSRVMGAVDGLEQEDPCDDFEVLSAWSDQEWELETVTATAESTRQQIQRLGQALRQLPTPAAPAGFAAEVMAAITQAEAPTTESLSALYDAETSFTEVRYLAGTELPQSARTQLQNFTTLSSALRRLPTEAVPAGFSERLLAALPQPELSFDTLSAHHDLEANLELPESPALLQSFERLSAGFAALPAIAAPEGFAARVLQAVDAAEFEMLSAHHDGETELEVNQPARLRQLAALSAGFAKLPAQSAPDGFAAGVLQAIEADFAALSAHHDGEAALELTESRQAQLHLLEALSGGFAALTAIQAPAGFAAGVMGAIDALPNFETISAAYDSEAALEVSDDQLQPLRMLSRAMAALPQPEAPAGFVAKVMLATEPVGKPKLFALPALFNTRMGQMVAGFAIFGMLVVMNQLVFQPGLIHDRGVVAVSDTYVVPVTHQAEDLLFNAPVIETVMDDTLELDYSTENDYNYWIGG